MTHLGGRGRVGRARAVGGGWGARARFSSISPARFSRGTPDYPLRVFLMALSDYPKISG
jgi:hypothetical protein